MTAVRFGYTPTHPGEVLKDEIEYRGISQRQLAEQMNFSYKALNDLLNGRRPITTSTAMMFEAADSFRQTKSDSKVCRRSVSKAAVKLSVRTAKRAGRKVPIPLRS